jgi:LPS sulfotransferase NodH
MLEDVETGYEGKFDFPEPAEPRLTYMIATVPRTGSTYLSHLLWETGCLGAPLEYVNFDKAGPYGFASESPDVQLRLWRSVLRRRTSPNRVFGVKCFPMQLQVLQEENPALLSSVLGTLLPPGGPRRVIYLSRRDRAAHLVSYARASLSGIWRKEQEPDRGVEVPYSEKALETAGRWIDHQAAGWEEMFRGLRIEPLRLWYEDVVSEPEETVRRIAGYLGVTIVPGSAPPIPAVLKQSDSDARNWMAKYADAKGRTR